MSAADHEGIVRSTMSVSDKIRALDAAGVPRADIARILGKRYQHVRNVLEADRLKGAPRRGAYGVEEAGRAFERPEATSGGAGGYRLRIQPDGGISLPSDVARLLGLQPGGVVICSLETGGMLLQSATESLRRLQALVPEWAPGEPMWSDELVAERRREAELDD